SVPLWRAQRQALVEPRACAWYGCCPLGSCRPQILLFPTVRELFAGRYSSAPRLHRKPLPSDDRRDIRETGVTRPIIRSSLRTIPTSSAIGIFARNVRKVWKQESSSTSLVRIS